MSNGYGGNSDYFSGFNDSFSSPFSSPFGKPRAADIQSNNGMDQDEDDDLKYNIAKEERNEPMTERQKRFQKFLQQKQSAQESRASGQPSYESGNFSKKGAKDKKKRQKKKEKLRKQKERMTSKKRANSLPRNNDNNDNNGDNDNDDDIDNTKKDDYIFFNEPQKKEQKTEAINNKQDKLKKEYEALNLELPKFDAASNKKHDKLMEIHSSSYRSIRVPGHRMIHVRRMWKKICEPIVNQLKLQIRMNSKKNVIELRMIEFDQETESALNNDKTGKKNRIQKGSDFIRAAVMGFEIRDALALIRMDDIYLETFDIRDVKFFNKKSDHWMRAIGRIAGQYGKIKYSIENSTNTRVVIFGFKVHILGSFSSIRLARNSISRLIIGSAPGNVYAKLRVVSNRLKHKF